MHSRRRSLKEDIQKGKYILNPDYDESEETRDAVMNFCVAASVRMGGAHDEFQNYFPQDFGKLVPEEGAWIIVHKSPQTEYTVPPFSIWYALPWQMDVGEVAGVKVKRVQILTPKGTLGIFPYEYALAQDIKSYVGREKDGVIFRKLDGEAIFPAEQLFYLQSRGIRRPDACMMLLDQMSGQNFGWFEIAPPYGEYYGQPWPSPEACPFATPLELWKQEPAQSKK
jgi:hypothetical protein